MHFLAIVISRPGYYDSLPFSWFVTVPFSFFPVILAFMSFNSKNVKDENNINITFLYLISKILMVPGFIVYLITNASHHTAQYIVGLVLFLLIDVILISAPSFAELPTLPVCAEVGNQAVTGKTFIAESVFP